MQQLDHANNDEGNNDFVSSGPWVFSVSRLDWLHLVLHQNNLHRQHPAVVRYVRKLRFAATACDQQKYAAASRVAKIIDLSERPQTPSPSEPSTIATDATTSTTIPCQPDLGCSQCLSMKCCIWCATDTICSNDVPPSSCATYGRGNAAMVCAREKYSSASFLQRIVDPMQCPRRRPSRAPCCFHVALCSWEECSSSPIIKLLQPLYYVEMNVANVERND